MCLFLLISVALVFLPHARLLRRRANPLQCCQRIMCVFVHLQERERGEANGLTYAAQRQLPRKRRAQGKSGNKLVSGAVCTSGEALRFQKNTKLELKGFIFLGVLAAVGLSHVCQDVKSQQWCTATRQTLRERRRPQIMQHTHTS